MLEKRIEELTASVDKLHDLLKNVAATLNKTAASEPAKKEEAPPAKETKKEEKAPKEDKPKSDKKDEKISKKTIERFGTLVRSGKQKPEVFKALVEKFGASAVSAIKADQEAELNAELDKLEASAEAPAEEKKSVAKVTVEDVVNHAKVVIPKASEDQKKNVAALNKKFGIERVSAVPADKAESYFEEFKKIFEQSDSLV